MARLAGDRLVLARKVVAYLLDPDHPLGAAKARFFGPYGFARHDPERLIAALSAHPDHNDIVAIESGAYGVKHVVQCRLSTPDGRDPCIRTVWMLEAGDTVHRLVTAYPVATRDRRKPST